MTRLSTRLRAELLKNLGRDGAPAFTPSELLGTAVLGGLIVLVIIVRMLVE